MLRMSGQPGRRSRVRQLDCLHDRPSRLSSCCLPSDRVVHLFEYVGDRAVDDALRRDGHEFGGDGACVRRGRNADGQRHSRLHVGGVEHRAVGRHHVRDQWPGRRIDRLPRGGEQRARDAPRERLTSTPPRRHLQEAAECRFTVTPAAPAVAAAGGNVAIQVQTNAACPWTARPTPAGCGLAPERQVRATARCRSPSRRTPVRRAVAQVIVAGTDVTIEQASGAAPRRRPAGSRMFLHDSARRPDHGGGRRSGNDRRDGTARAPARGAAVSNAAWMAITGGACGGGQRPGDFQRGRERRCVADGTISVAGQTFTLTQAGVSCSYSINPSSEAVPAAGGTSTIAVMTGGSCAWTSASNAAVDHDCLGRDRGPDLARVKLNVAANSGTARTGTATIAAQTFTVTQAAAPCGFALSPGHGRHRGRRRGGQDERQRGRRLRLERRVECHLDHHHRRIVGHRERGRRVQRGAEPRGSAQRNDHHRRSDADRHAAGRAVHVLHLAGGTDLCFGRRLRERSR